MICCYSVVVSSLSPASEKVLLFLLAVRLIWILAVCWPLRQKAVFSLVRWPCFGRVGRVMVWPGPQLVGAKPCALAREHHPAKRPPTSSKNYGKDFSTMHCNVPQIWLSAAQLPEGFCVSYVSFCIQLSRCR